jgi:hypothetical protein
MSEKSITEILHDMDRDQKINKLESYLNQLKKYKNTIERKIRRNRDRIDEYESNKDNLSVYGYWSLGYYIGINSELENLLDEIEEILE